MVIVLTIELVSNYTFENPLWFINLKRAETYRPFLKGSLVPECEMIVVYVMCAEVIIHQLYLQSY